MKAFFIFLIIFTFITAPLSQSVAQDQKYDNDYKESTFSPIPPKLSKIKNRFVDWQHRSAMQAKKIMTSDHPNVVAWRDAILNINEKDEVAMMNEINRITNRSVHYVDDYKHYKKDFWAGPMRTLVEGGDCEDIALLKLVGLQLRGIDVDKRTRLLIGMIFYQGREQAHAVLEVDISNNRHLVMRSLNDDVLTFKNMDRVMKPIYMVNEHELVVFDKNKKYAYLLDDEVGDQTMMPAAGSNKFKYNN